MMNYNTNLYTQEQLAQVRRIVKKNHAMNKNYAACSFW